MEQRHGNGDVSREKMKDVCVRVRNGKAICIAYAIEDRCTEGR
jgi:hypothetical protein